MNEHERLIQDERERLEAGRPTFWRDYAAMCAVMLLAFAVLWVLLR